MYEELQVVKATKIYQTKLRWDVLVQFYMYILKKREDMK